MDREGIGEERFGEGKRRKSWDGREATVAHMSAHPFDTTVEAEFRLPLEIARCTLWWVFFKGDG